MLTEYDVQRISAAIVDRLVNDEKFMRRMAKMMPKKSRMLSSSQASEILGVSRYTVVAKAVQLGGIRKGNHKRSHWTFPEEGLIEKYLSL